MSEENKSEPIKTNPVQGPRPVRKAVTELEEGHIMIYNERPEGKPKPQGPKSDKKTV